MKIMSRSFSRGEKILILVLAIVLISLIYYWFVDQPVREAITNSNAESAQLQTELDIVLAETARMNRLQAELEDIQSTSVSWMGSYNSSEAELRELNNVLTNSIQYTINFSNVTRSGDLIRRNFSLQFQTRDYPSASAIIKALEQGEYRCQIGDAHCTVASNGVVTIIAAATFFETMVGGTPDAGLPQSTTDTVSP